MNYKELCETLNSNKEQKDVFFRNVKAPEFLPYFEKYNVLTFDNNTGYAVIQYLTYLINTNKNIKSNIAQIINKNIVNYKDMSGYVFEAMLNLLKEFSIHEIEDLIDIDALFLMDNAYLFCEFLLKNNISDNQYLYKKCIETLTNYKVYEDPIWKTKSAASIHGAYMYQIKELSNTLPYKENLKKLLCKKEIFEILIKQYEKIYNEIGELSYFDRPYVKALEPISGENIESFDVRNLLIDYISVNLENNYTQNSVVNLIYSKAQMLNKLGLYAIFLNKHQFKNIFVEFFNSFKVDYIPFYIYELMSILEDDEFNIIIDKAIYNRIMSFDDPLKYRFLHALKNNFLFRDEFLILKEKYGIKIENPKIIFSINTVDVHSVSPIKEETFLKRSITKQIKYINNYKTSVMQNIEITKETIKSSEFELYNIFKKALDNNLDKYLHDIEMPKLNKPGAIIAFFDTIENACIQNKTFDMQCVIKLLKIYLNQKKDDNVFNYNCTKMLLQLIQKTNSQTELASIFEIEENQIKLWKNALFASITNELSYLNSICPLGQYLKVWFSCWIRNKNIFKDKKQFLYDNFDQKDNLPNQLLYYNLGQYYGLLNDACNIKIEEIESQLLKEAFLEGFINNKNNLNSWATFTNYIIEYLKKLDKNENNMNWKNFIYSLIHIKFANNNEEIFQSIYKFMNAKQKTDFVWNTLFPIRNPKYDKHLILKYWKEEIHSKNSANVQILLTIFSEYAECKDFENNLLNLKKLFTRFTVVKDNSLKTLLELEDFLTKLDLYIKNLYITDEESFNKTEIEIFKMLKTFIPIFSKYEYISIQESHLLKAVLEDYIKKFKAKDDVKILKELIYKTKNLIQYSDIFQKI